MASARKFSDKQVRLLIFLLFFYSFFFLCFLTLDFTDNTQKTQTAGPLDQRAARMLTYADVC
jgi:hypothetical protein